MAHIEIEFTSHAIRAILFGDDSMIQGIIEADDALVMAESLHTRGWYGTGLNVLYKDWTLGEGELSLAEELELHSLGLTRKQ